MIVYVFPSTTLDCLILVIVSNCPFGRQDCKYVWIKLGWPRPSLVPFFWVPLVPFLGFFYSFIAVTLSCNDLIPIWSILWPIHSVPYLQKLNLVSLNLYPEFYSVVTTSISSFFVVFFLKFSCLRFCNLTMLSVCFPAFDRSFPG